MDVCQNLRLSWFLVTIVAASSSAYAADQVTRQSDGEIIRGELISLEESSIVIRRSNDEEVRIPPDDIRDIRFHREPPALQTARSNERAGEYAAAIEQLREVQADYKGSDERVNAEIDFLIARCQAHQAFDDLDQSQQAIDLLQAFLQQNGGNYRVLEAKLLQARLLATSDSAQAASLLTQVQKSGVDGFSIQAGLILAQTLLSDDKAADALKIYSDLIGQSQGKPAILPLHFEARIGRAQCLQQLSRFEEASNLLKSVVDAAPQDQSVILAQAWLRLGDCERTQDNTQAALLAYLHVDLLYAEEADAHAEALHFLGPLWTAAGHPARARDAQSRLAALYPDSPWAQPSR